MKRWAVVVSMSLLVILGIAACGGGDNTGSNGRTSSGTTDKSTSSSGGAVITIKNLAFSGADSAKAGSSVTVKNDDSTKHTFTPDNVGDFKAAVLESGTAASVVFDKVGTFGYHCSIHTSMKGSITVTR